MSKVVVYYTNWARYRQPGGRFLPENLDPGKSTHIIYAFTILNAETLKMQLLPDTETDLPKVIDLKKRNNKVLIAIGGWNDSQLNNGDKYERLFANAQSRAAFIADVVNFLQQRGLDGLDIDYEYPNNKASFAQFIRELSAAMKPKGLLLTAAVAAPKWRVDQAYDVPALASSLDWINLMTYDFHGAWDHKTGHVAPFDEVANSVAYWQQLGMPADKIVLGFPSYGKSFTLSNPNQNGINAPTTGPGNSGEFTREGGILAYYEIMKMINAGQLKLVKNSFGSYAYGGNQWVSFDLPEDFVRKIRIAKEKRLGGLMLWAPDFDDFHNGYPLLTKLWSGRSSKSWFAPISMMPRCIKRTSQNHDEATTQDAEENTYSCCGLCGLAPYLTKVVTQKKLSGGFKVTKQ